MCKQFFPRGWWRSESGKNKLLIIQWISINGNDEQWTNHHHRQTCPNKISFRFARNFGRVDRFHFIHASIVRILIRRKSESPVYANMSACFVKLVWSSEKHFNSLFFFSVLSLFIRTFFTSESARVVNAVNREWRAATTVSFFCSLAGFSWLNA